jgi:hypothetical protein
MDWLRNHVLAWSTSSAATLVGLRLVTPSLIDFVFDILTVGLVFVAAKLAKK